MIYGLGAKAQAAYTALAVAMQDGTYPPGSKLPSHLELARTFGVAPLTLRNVLAHLEAQGLVRRERGRGTFVLDRTEIRVDESHRLATVIGIQREIDAAALDPALIMHTVCERICQVTGAGLAGIALREGDGVTWHGSSGPLAAAALATGPHDSLTHSLVGVAIRTDQTVVTHNRESELGRLVGPQLGVQSCLVIPLHREGQVIGALGVASTATNAFAPADVDTLQLLSHFLEAALSRAAEFEDRQRSLAELGIAADALRESESRFQSLYRKQPIPTYVWRRMGADWVLMDANHAAELATHDRIAGFMGVTASVLLANHPELLHAFEHCVHTRLPVRQAYHYQDSSTGQQADTIASFAYVPPDQVVVHVEDVTEQKRYEQALRESEERFRQSFEHAGVGMAITALDGSYLQVNPAMSRILGYSREEFLHHTFVSLTYPDDTDMSASFVDRMLAGEIESYQLEKRYLHRDGHPVWVMLTAALIRDANGRPQSFISQVEDISERKRAEEALRSSEERYRKLFEHAQEIVYVLDLQGHLIMANQAAYRALGYGEAALRQRDIVSLVAPEYRPLVRRMMREKIRHGLPTSFEVAMLAKDGRHVLLEVNSQVISAAGQPAGIQGIARDITERHSFEERLRYQALHDSLTDLPNRAFLTERLEEAVQEAREAGQQMAFLLMDIDRFKEINDTFGHYSGDRLLQEVSSRLRATLDDSVLVARLGGDEFGVIVPRAGQAEALAVAGRVQDAFLHPFTVEGHQLAVGTSLGIALFPEHGNDVTTLMRRADVAMYTSKRNALPAAIYRAETDEYNPERLALGTEVRYAVERGELYLDFQPAIDLRSGRVSHVEALVRWQHPRLGSLAPAQFVPLAENSGMIRPLTVWVLNQALRQCRVWHDQGLRLSVAVNLSVRNLHDPDLLPTIDTLLHTWGLPPSSLIAEITERAIMDDSSRAQESLTGLHQRGIHTSIDDFGTGYSSLSHLRHRPIDEIKIAPSFIRDMATGDAGALAIARSVIELGRNLGLRVLAEGIEDADTLHALRVLGCNLGQGFHLCPPLNGEALLAWHRGRAAVAP